MVLYFNTASKFLWCSLEGLTRLELFFLDGHYLSSRNDVCDSILTFDDGADFFPDPLPKSFSFVDG